ncbi:hypothetical protein [Streptomyces gilvosporeus]|uniref:Translation elongation factor EFG/EF2 domain-containing protein n=1 Tax=Streptomyces gilvosporeus TaxID=553510 RepID=A0A1V0TNI8_9ACTN|nr:hypothetical protein [Streptomyces gilvosporeus]ARF54358.1 hypothetical protein B1H19_09235 [Streptomyces gilvosporeus]
MTTAAEPFRFPPEPVRNVRIRHLCQTSCGGPFAIVTLDFEPLPDEEFAPVAFDWPVRDRQRNRDLSGRYHYPREWLPDDLAQALEEGVAQALRALPADIRPAAWCTVTEAVWHEVDSHERGFRQAGAMAVREALRRCGR